MNITKIIVVTDTGADTILLETNLPNGSYPFTGFQECKMTIAAGTAEEYVKKHFPNIPLEVIHTAPKKQVTKPKLSKPKKN